MVTKEKIREYYLKYYQKNRQNILLRHRQWRLDNPEKTKAANKPWKLNNPERHREMSRKANIKSYYKNEEKNRDRNREYARRYYRENKAEMILKSCIRIKNLPKEILLKYSL